LEDGGNVALPFQPVISRVLESPYAGVQSGGWFLLEVDGVTGIGTMTMKGESNVIGNVIAVT